MRVERTSGIEATAPRMAGPDPLIHEVTREDCVEMVGQAKDFLGTRRAVESYVGLQQLTAEQEKLRLDAIDPADNGGYLAAFMREEYGGRESFTTTLNDFALHAESARLPVLAWHALRACDRPERTCPMHLEERLLDLDRDNSEAWVMVAQMRHRRGDTVGALVAMQGAAQASTSTWYLTETMAIFERALARYTSILLADRVDIANSMATVFSPTWAGTGMCRAESEASSAWLEACLGFATLRAERNVSDAAQEYGYALRNELLNTRGDTEGAAEAAAKIEFLRAQRREANEVKDLLLFLRKELVASSPERFNAQLEAIREFGEIEGYDRFLRKELPLFLERAGWRDLPAAHECFAKFIQEPKVVKPGGWGAPL